MNCRPRSSGDHPRPRWLGGRQDNLEETSGFEAIAEPLKALLAGYEKDGAPMMIGDSNEEVAWDGFEFIRPDDPRYFDTVIEDLRWKGYDFRERPPEEPKG